MGLWQRIAPPSHSRVGKRAWTFQGRLRVVSVIAWTLAILLGIELVAQVREQLLSGRSALNHLDGSPPDFTRDPVTGLRLLRPNAVIRGQVQEIRSNSLGLRSDEIPSPKPPGERRIALVGASSVMGAFSTTNDDTLPAFLQRSLQARLPAARIRVVNAGITGAALIDERRMLDYLAEHVAPDLVIVYAGSNDLTQFCREKPDPATGAAAYRLPQLALPSGLLSVDLLLKNTVSLRPVQKVSTRLVDAERLDLGRIRTQLEALIAAAQQRGIPIVLSTNATSYRREQAPDKRQRLAQTALYYNSCFDLPGLVTVNERFNALIREVAASRGVAVLPVGETVPGGPTYFHDSVHFTSAGKRLVAEIYADHVLSRGALVWDAQR